MAKLAWRPTLVTIQQFMNKAEEFINQEETIRALMKSKVEVGQGGANNSKVVLESSRKKRKEEKSSKTLGKKVEPQRQQGQRLTSLNTSVTELLIEIRRDPNCISLRHEIENFIKNGRLVRFLFDERDRGRNPQKLLRLYGNNEGLERRRDDCVVRPRQSLNP